MINVGESVRHKYQCRWDGKSQDNGLGTLPEEEWPHFARNEIGINHGRLSLIIIKLDRGRRRGMGGQRPTRRTQPWKLRFLLRGEKISVFRASPAEEITPIISRASLEASVLAEKSPRMANSSRWCYLDCYWSYLPKRTRGWKICMKYDRHAAHLWRTPSTPCKTFWRGPWLFSRLRRFICIERCAFSTLSSRVLSLPLP